jgi:hypothetical protein
MNALTLRELELRRAQLAERAERLRQEWRTAPSAGPRALSLGKEVRSLQERADDLTALLRVAEGMS